jgi:SAM-dependent methyltransferase
MRVRGNPLYQEDLAFIQAMGFGDLAERAAPALISLLRGAAVVVRRVVDVGCGTGITTRALVDAGFETTAIEPSESLLKMARPRAPGALFHQASVYEVDLPLCEALVAVGEPLTYHEPNVDADARVEGFFQRAAKAIAPQGLLILDVICTEGPSLAARTWRSETDWAILSETTENLETRRLTRTIETFRKEGDRYRRAREVHHVRLFDELQMRGWLERAGFAVETRGAYGDDALLPRRVAFIGVRRG